MNFSKIGANVSARMFRRGLMLFPPMRNSGVKVDRISDDWLEWDLRLPLGMKTRNYLGTHFGGTLYSAADPQYMLAWLHILGPDYIVWDKAATIRFKRPGRTHLHGRIRITTEQVEEVKARCEVEPKLDMIHHFQWLDEHDVVVAEIEKVIHFRKKES